MGDYTVDNMMVITALVGYYVVPSFLIHRTEVLAGAHSTTPSKPSLNRILLARLVHEHAGNVDARRQRCIKFSCTGKA